MNLTKLQQRIFKPIDIAGLVYFRIVFGMIMLWSIYIGVIMIAMTKALNLVTEIPNRVLTWIGAQGGQEDSSWKEVQQKAEKGAKVGDDMREAGKAGAKDAGKQGANVLKSGVGGLKAMGGAAVSAGKAAGGAPDKPGGIG